MVGIVILQLSICRRVAQNATALFCYLQLNIRRPTVAHEAVNLKPIITKVFKLEEFQEAYEAVKSGKELKVEIEP